MVLLGPGLASIRLLCVDLSKSHRNDRHAGVCVKASVDVDDATTVSH